MKNHAKAALLSLVAWLAGVGPGLADGILVFGGTGRLGSEIVKQLINAGEQDVTVFARPSSDRKRLDGLDVTFVTGNVLDEAQVESALKSNSFRVVINALSQAGNNSDRFYEDSQKHISKWAKAADVERIVLNSSVGAGESRDTYPNRMRTMFAAVLDDKEKAENNLVKSGVPYTIIRNYRIIEEPAPVTGRAYLTDDQMAKGGIGRADLAILNVYCLRSACAGKIFHAIESED